MAVLVDFDGTACDADVANELLVKFGVAGWERHDEAVDRGDETVREGIEAQTAMLLATRREMLEYVLEHFAVSGQFVSFVHWAEANGLPLAVASDGFGFYVRPMLAAVGMPELRAWTNGYLEGRGGPRLTHPHRHPHCIGCGVCKLLAVKRLQTRSGRVAFVGNGLSDRYAAQYADLVFAREPLASICAQEGVQAIPWRTFEDVQAALAKAGLPQRHVGPAVCPGWIKTATASA